MRVSVPLVQDMSYIHCARTPVCVHCERFAQKHVEQTVLIRAHTCKEQVCTLRHPVATRASEMLGPISLAPRRALSRTCRLSRRFRSIWACCRVLLYATLTLARRLKQHRSQTKLSHRTAISGAAAGLTRSAAPSAALMHRALLAASLLPVPRMPSAKQLGAPARSRSTSRQRGLPRHPEAS